MDRETSHRIVELLRHDRDHLGRRVSVQGWVRTRRDSKAGISFIEINDGSCLRNLQVVAEMSDPALTAVLPVLSTGCSVTVVGDIVPSPGQGQSVELRARRLVLHGSADPAIYPLQKKRHSFEFLRQIAHLRPRTNALGAVARVRNRLSYAIHQFFQEHGFCYVHTPIITASDCEGAGEVFRVTTLAPGHGGEGTGGDAASDDFFGRPTYLTVSGQLQAEILALALGRVYTFGPTFRAENSNTTRHLAEFWMVEPEIAFCDLEENLRWAERFLKAVVTAVLDDCTEDLEFFARFMESSLLDSLTRLVASPFEILTYTEAVELLAASGASFSCPVTWGNDLQVEHERYLTEKKVGGPVAIIHFPRSLKPFYMRVNDDGRTVAAMDVLVPRVGEIIGGSQREDRVDVLREQLRFKGVSAEAYRWYVELRQFGSAPHAGFGLGLERLVQFVTALANIREAIPFPRTPGNADF